VVDTWVKKGRPAQERIGAATARVRGVLAHFDTLLRVACLPDDFDAILGWAAIDVGRSPPRLHFVYVRKEARGQGIARSLLAGVEKPESDGKDLV
jgi:GNAT superfamily N-acetyltransferase